MQDLITTQFSSAMLSRVWKTSGTTPVRHVEQNLTNLRTVGCRFVAQLDSRGCDRLEFVEDGQIVEHVPRGTGIDHNCLRVEFVTNMVRGYKMTEAAWSNWSSSDEEFVWLN
jgi:hypothetical protein